MNVKEFLTQARKLDLQIKAKIDQIQNLSAMVVRCTCAFRDVPICQEHGKSKLDECIPKIIDLQNEVCEDMLKLFHVKRDTMRAIDSVTNVDYKLILTKRYISDEPWEKIADDLGFDLRYLYKMHRRALQEVKYFL